MARAQRVNDMSETKRANIRYGGDGSRDVVIDGYVTHFRERNPNASVAKELKRLLCIAIAKEQGKAFLGQAVQIGVSADSTVVKKNPMQSTDSLKDTSGVITEEEQEVTSKRASPKTAKKVPQINITI